jgi:hypothetical protein
MIGIMRFALVRQKVGHGSITTVTNKSFYLLSLALVKSDTSVARSCRMKGSGADQIIR